MPRRMMIRACVLAFVFDVRHGVTIRVDRDGDVLTDDRIAETLAANAAMTR